MASPSGKAGACKAPILSSNLSATFLLKVLLLYIIATPIGNLKDLSFRAVDTLQNVDYILCEDTRTSHVLLHHYSIEKKCISHHKFNEKKNLETIIDDLKGGKEIALISDAGTPCINDPGLILTQRCIAEKIPYTLIPGPCSIIQALVLSGMSLDRFQFIGFLSKSGLENTLKSALFYPGTTAAFESPKRLLATLKKLQSIAPHAQVVILREMTKLYEEAIRGPLQELISHFEKKPPRGELVIALEGGAQNMEHFSSVELIELLRELHGMDLKEAIKGAAKLQKIPKREVYQKIHDF